MRWRCNLHMVEWSSENGEKNKVCWYGTYLGMDCAEHIVPAFEATNKPPWVPG